MARVTYTGISDYATRGAAAVNSIWTSFQTQSTEINDANVRDEGLDRRNIASQSAVDGTDKKSYNGSHETFTPAAAYPTWNDLTFTSGPTAISINNGGSGWSVGPGVGKLRIRFTAEFSYDLGARTNVTTENIRFRISYVSNLGTTTPLVAQSIHRAHTRISSVSGAAGDLALFRDHVQLLYLIEGSASETTISSVKIQWATDGHDLQVGHCALVAARFRKVA